MMKPSKIRAVGFLQNALKAIPSLANLRSSSPEFKKWHRDTEVAIEHTFGNGTRHVSDFKCIRFSIPGISTAPIAEAASRRSFDKGLASAKAVLESMIDEVENYWGDGGATTNTSELPDQPKNGKNVFIVHGHDAEVKETVARFITSLGLTPIILHEQPNQGRTIIEKFEKHAHVAFALALLTPDDHGSLAEHNMELKSRARQNVIFEFGYFIGRLGRQRVCALTKGDIEIPSDYDGVLYLPLDEAGTWKKDLVRELNAAGCDVGTNHTF